MNEVLREILFPCAELAPKEANWLLLVMRLLFGGLLLVHGIQKVKGYRTLAGEFPDPIGIGSRRSLQLAIFAEFLCSMAVITGLFFRLALIPPIITMFVAGFYALKGQPWLQRELPFSYMMAFFILMIFGPGAYSLDYLINLWI